MINFKAKHLPCSGTTTTNCALFTSDLNKDR